MNGAFKNLLFLVNKLNIGLSVNFLAVFNFCLFVFCENTGFYNFFDKLYFNLSEMLLKSFVFGRKIGKDGRRQFSHFMKKYIEKGFY